MHRIAITILGLIVAACTPGGEPSETEPTAPGQGTGQTGTSSTSDEADDDSSDLDAVDIGPVMVEPNDVSQPFELGRVPGRVSGYYDGAGDVDALVVTTAQVGGAGGTTVEVSPVPDMRPTLRLLDGDVDPPLVLAVWSAERPGQGAGVPNLGAVEGVERLIVEVSEAEGRASTRPYTVLLHRPEPREGDWIELEPNDEPASAGRIGESGSLAGYFHTSQDRDLFRLVLQRDASVSVMLHPDTATDVSIRWRVGDAAGEVSQNFAGVGQVEQLCARFAPAGEHLIEAAPRSVDLARLSTYSLQVRIETDQTEREPNDRPIAGEMQIVEGEMRGYIESTADVDVFGFRMLPALDGTAEQVIEVAPPPGVDVAIEVQDDVGDSVAPLADRAGRGQPERVSVPRVFMTYRVLISSGRQGGTSCETSYRVYLPAE